MQIQQDLHTHLYTYTHTHTLSHTKYTHNTATQYAHNTNKKEEFTDIDSIGRFGTEKKNFLRHVSPQINERMRLIIISKKEYSYGVANILLDSNRVSDKKMKISLILVSSYVNLQSLYYVY